EVVRDRPAPPGRHLDHDEPVSAALDDAAPVRVGVRLAAPDAGLHGGARLRAEVLRPVAVRVPVDELSRAAHRRVGRRVSEDGAPTGGASRGRGRGPRGTGRRAAPAAPWWRRAPGCGGSAPAAIPGVRSPGAGAPGRTPPGARGCARPR